jgi:hypothetical protein
MHFPGEMQDILLPFDTDKHPEPSFDGRTLSPKPSEAQRLTHEVVVDLNIGPHGNAIVYQLR